MCVFSLGSLPVNNLYYIHIMLPGCSQPHSANIYGINFTLTANGKSDSHSLPNFIRFQFLYADMYTRITVVFNACVAGRKAMFGEKKVVHKEPVRLQSNNINEDEDVELKECPAYVKPCREVDINLENCPAYVESKKDMNIILEECPAYGESKRTLNTSLDTCPAYEQIANLK